MLELVVVRIDCEAMGYLDAAAGSGVYVTRGRAPLAGRAQQRAHPERWRGQIGGLAGGVASRARAAGDTDDDGVGN
ncbi:hypothetical protein Misp01_83720 [Microtetraspora sp. NBRC 13810]|nr:hypothetical protein Misp01_83720 [Microtetraspora sp. NBRC 13810]